MKNWLRNIYLYLSDCDGMCMFCEPTLKKLCEEQKAKAKKEIEHEKS